MFGLFVFPQILPGAEYRMAAVIAFTAAAAWFDVFNRKWVPNYLIYGFLAASLLLNLVFFDSRAFTLGAAFSTAVFVLCYPIYRQGQLGGADMFILASITLALPFLPSPLLAQPGAAPYPFILSVLVPTGLLFILHMASQFVPFILAKIERREIAFDRTKIAGSALIGPAFLAIFLTFSSIPIEIPAAYTAIMGALFLSLAFFSLFREEVKSSMIEEIPVTALEEEDVLALEMMDERFRRNLRLTPLLNKHTIAALQSSGIREVPVYTGMPAFLPYLFVGTLFTILFGDMLHYIVSL